MAFLFLFKGTLAYAYHAVVAVGMTEGWKPFPSQMINRFAYISLTEYFIICVLGRVFLQAISQR